MKIDEEPITKEEMIAELIWAKDEAKFQQFVESIQDGDDLLFFRHDNIGPLCGSLVMGYLIRRNGEVVGRYVTAVMLA